MPQFSIACLAKLAKSLACDLLGLSREKGIEKDLGFIVPLKCIEYGSGYVIIRSPYTPYSIYFRGTIGLGIMVPYSLLSPRKVKDRPELALQTTEEAPVQDDAYEL